MKDCFNEIINCPLFVNIKDSDQRNLLECLMAKKIKYDKNEFIFTAGGAVQFVGIVISGCALVVHEDYWGARTILAHIEPGSLFGEAISCAEIEDLPFSVIASKKTEVILIDYKKIISTCPASCAFHIQLIKNMIKIIALKNVTLTQKMEIITRRTTRERILTYLSMYAQKTGKSRFIIPFNRQELADYLSVERSAMSAELSRMQADGLIKTNKSEFELLD